MITMPGSDVIIVMAIDLVAGGEVRMSTNAELMSVSSYFFSYLNLCCHKFRRRYYSWQLLLLLTISIVIIQTVMIIYSDKVTKT